MVTIDRTGRRGGQPDPPLSGRTRLRPAALLAAALLAATLLAACSGGAATRSVGGPGRSTGPTLPAAGSGPTGPSTPSTGSASSTPSSGVGASTTGACSDQSVVRSWPVSRQAAQVLAVPVLDAGPAAVAVARSYQAGGILLLGSLPAPQLAAALRPVTTGAALPRPFVMVDQEGGGVQRLGSDVTSMPWPRQMATTMSPAQVEELAQTVGRQMAGLGVGVDLAPVLDLDGGAQLSASDPDGPRSFGTDPAVAASYGQAFVSGLQAGGVLAVVKHFPGLGGASGNTDYGPASTRPLAQLETAGLIPFERALTSGTRAVMVANATVPGLATQPASLSAAVISGLLRGQLHFNGLVMTDSLSAGAVRAAGYSLESATVAALQAGADMVLFGSTLTPADTAALAPGPLAAQTQALVSAITKAVSTGALSASRLDAAVLHVVQAKGVNLCSGGAG